MFSLRGRIILDALLALLFVLAFGFQLTGEAAHELIGAAAFILLIVHLVAGWTWVKTLFTGPFSIRRRLTLLANMLLFLAMTAVFGSGLILFLKAGGMGARQVHTVAAYWSLVLTGVHVGLYWEKAVSGLRAIAKSITGQWSWGWAVHLPKVGLLFALYGVWASYERSMGSKLFLGYSFDFWDESRPAFLFFVNYFAVMSLYTISTRYALRLLGTIFPPGKRETAPPG